MAMSQSKDSNFFLEEHTKKMRTDMVNETISRNDTEA